MAITDNRAQQSQKRFQELLSQFQQSNADNIKNNATAPTDTKDSFSFVAKQVNSNSQIQSEKQQNAKSHAAKANNARIANTPEPKQAQLQSSNLFNLGF